MHTKVRVTDATCTEGLEKQSPVRQQQTGHHLYIRSHYGLPGEGNGNPLQYSCLENSMDRGAWWATVHGVAKSRTRLSDFTSLTGFQQQ